jgi:GDP-L-fucose synthase
VEKEMKERVVVTGGAGFLGSHVVEELHNRGYENVFVPRRSEYDLRTYAGNIGMLYTLKPDILIHLAANCGGIGLNQAKPAELFCDNALMGILMMEAARTSGVKKFVQIGTVCSYPNLTPVPFKEQDIWNGYPEETNAPYGLAKKMLLVQGQAYRKQYGFNVIHLIPVNLYGPGDHFDLVTSHVVPALINKFYNAVLTNQPEVQVWGTGAASREFLYIKDAARGIVDATENYDGADPVNLGSGSEVTIVDLAHMIADEVGYKGAIFFDATKPDGQPRRRLDVSKAEREFGFVAQTSLEDGLRQTIKWYQERHDNQ